MLLSLLMLVGEDIVAVDVAVGVAVGEDIVAVDVAVGEDIVAVSIKDFSFFLSQFFLSQFFVMTLTMLL